MFSTPNPRAAPAGARWSRAHQHGSACATASRSVSATSPPPSRRAGSTNKSRSPGEGGAWPESLRRAIMPGPAPFRSHHDDRRRPPPTSTPPAGDAAKCKAFPDRLDLPCRRFAAPSSRPSRNSNATYEVPTAECASGIRRDKPAKGVPGTALILLWHPAHNRRLFFFVA